MIFDNPSFEWDNGNLEKNWRKHRVGFRECESVFYNKPLLVRHDKTHSVEEERYFVLGKTTDERLLFVVFTTRGNKIRVISARDMNREERRTYEEAQKNSKI